MKLSTFVGRWGGLSLLLGIGLLMGGCHTGGQFSDVPGVAPAPEGSTTGGATNAEVSLDKIAVGDSLVINITDTPQIVYPIKTKVREDGKVTVLQNIDFTAAGKTTGQLQKEIHDCYVPKYYVTMTVAVEREPTTQFYYVGGEVKLPGRQVYISRVHVLGAIKSAGDFTDYAQKKKVRLTRANGSITIIDAKQALKDPKLDLEVYPGDNIHVPRRYNPFSF